MAAEPVQLPTSGSLAGILDVLETDEDFRALISDEIEVPESDIDPSITVGVPEGLRPALAAGAAGTRPVVLVVASGREAEEMVEAIRSWYSGDPNDVAQLEAWETLPHERLSPRADTVASRMAVFRRLMHPQEGSKLFGPIRILVMPVRSLIQPVVAGLGDVEPLVFSQGEELALDEASHRLVENAYTRVDLVMDRGEFAVRGGIIDVFPPTLPHPVRIEFFGDEIDTIKEFHASDQRTYGSDIPMVWATPCRELQLTEKVRVRAKSLIGSIPNAEDMLESIANAIPVEGMESLLPALVDDMEPVQGMLPKRALVMLSDPEKLRRSADDLAKPPMSFLLPAGMSPHPVTVPVLRSRSIRRISTILKKRFHRWFSQGTTYGSLRVSVWTQAGKGTFSSTSPIPANIAGMKSKQHPVLKVFLMPAMPSLSLQERKVLLSDSNVPSTKRESPTSTASDRVPSTDSSIMPRKSRCLPNAT